MSPFTAQFGSFKGPFKPSNNMQHSPDNYFRNIIGDLFFLAGDDGTNSPAFVGVDKAHLNFEEARKFGVSKFWCYIDLTHIEAVKINTRDELEVFIMLYPNLTQLLTETFDGGLENAS